VIAAWRLCQRKWAARAFDGHGAALYPGRWNRAGARVVYVAESRSLAALEVLANVADKTLLTHAQWILIPVQFDPALVFIPERVPPKWRHVPAPEATRDFGQQWLAAARHPAMRVPSAVTLGEFNYLLNPLHPAFGRLEIGKPEVFDFDPRLA